MNGRDRSRMTPIPEVRRNVLLVEDNEMDRFLTEKAFSRIGDGTSLHMVSDGDLALRYLGKQAPFGDAPTPDLILLDLNMPRMNGRDVLAAICADPGIAKIPVVVLTTSDAEQDRLDMYRLRCSSYVVKSVDFENFCQTLARLLGYWFGVVALPPR